MRHQPLVDRVVEHRARTSTLVAILDELDRTVIRRSDGGLLGCLAQVLRAGDEELAPLMARLGVLDRNTNP